MKLSQLTAKPQLIDVHIDDEDTIKGDGMIEATLKLYRGDTIYLKPWSALEHGLEQAAMSDKSSFSGSLLEELDN